MVMVLHELSVCVHCVYSRGQYKTRGRRKSTNDQRRSKEDARSAALRLCLNHGKNLYASGATTMAQGHKFQDLEEMGEALLEYVNSTQTDKLALMKAEHQALFDQHVETKKIVTQILKEEAQIEESVGQRLLDMEEEKQQRDRELEGLEQQLRQCMAKSQITDSELQFLKGELESLRNAEDQLETLQSEVDEDTTEVIPSAVYVAQVYYLITKIKWEYETPPNILKGVHYGTDLATPINIDTTARSRSNVSDQLWGFVSTEW
ncbi:kinetochore protein Spc24 isoform X1 [Scophthalmus maximus]|uniref:kinetochore protein Spc24 isoform X1 n=1 Tax=Scophthalmus maximus TaxID=52904 RepID=UPI0015E0DFB8|nr:kinetochore protein Spc24 isoform X1 [Scophthalmus maximus]